MRGQVKSTNRGLALIATISIMPLIVMVILALLSLSTVTTRASNYSELLQIAKVNARVGLAEAILNLQFEVIPDQRVTSWSSILADSESSDAITSVRQLMKTNQLLE